MQDIRQLMEGHTWPIPGTRFSTGLPPSMLNIYYLLHTFIGFAAHVVSRAVSGPAGRNQFASIQHEREVMLVAFKHDYIISIKILCQDKLKWNWYFYGKVIKISSPFRQTKAETTVDEFSCRTWTNVHDVTNQESSYCFSDMTVVDDHYII